MYLPLNFIRLVIDFHCFSLSFIDFQCFFHCNERANMEVPQPPKYPPRLVEPDLIFLYFFVFCWLDLFLELFFAMFKVCFAEMTFIRFMTTTMIVVAILRACFANHLRIVALLFGTSEGRIFKVPFVLLCTSSTFKLLCPHVWPPAQVKVRKSWRE